MHSEQVLVYRYSSWDEENGAHRTSTAYATIAAIREGLGIPIFETAEWVPLSDVAGGIYRPKRAPSGIGESPPDGVEQAPE